MRELALAEIENVSGGFNNENPGEDQLTMDPVVVNHPGGGIWQDLGMTAGEYIFGANYDSLLIDHELRFDTITVQGHHGAGSGGGEAVSNATNSAIFLFTDEHGGLHWYDAYFLKDGFFDINDNGVQDNGEIAFSEGDTAFTDIAAYNEAAAQWTDQHGGYVGDGATPAQTAGFLDSYTPFPDQNQYF